MPDVNRYLWHRKRNALFNRKITKYIEAFWRFIFYSAFCILGYQVLFVPAVAPWVQDTKNHWMNWPFHQISPMMLFYYQIELGCYFHQLFWTEVNRSDAMEMILHHFITIFLIVGSYVTNYTRVGVSILLLHDMADIFLEIAKVFNYTSEGKNNKWMKDYLVDPIFGVFAVTFFITRLVLYPRYILYSVLIEGYEVFGCEWGGCYYFVLLLVGLQLLHVFWFYLIARMIFKLMMGTMTKDERSDDEDALEDEMPPTPTGASSSSSSSPGSTAEVSSTETSEPSKRRQKKQN